MASLRPSSHDFHDKKYMMFTRNNVQRAVRNVGVTDRLGIWLGVHERRRREIQSQFRGDEGQQVEEYVTYFMDHDPLASWRPVIVVLDQMKLYGEKEGADKIRHLAESVTDPTLTINNLRHVTSSVQDWDNLGDYYYGLGVPHPVRDEIKKDPALTEEEKKTKVLLYFLHNVPMASWERVAGALYYMKEERALQAVKEFLPDPPEASLTPENLSTVLDIMSDCLWREFGGYANIPDSEIDRIKAQCTSDRECKQALIHSFVSSHPAPSWTLVAWALYMTERDKGDGSSLRALDHLQQLFPTGRFRSKQIYEQEMKRGHIELDLDKMLLFGTAGSGKTCSLAALLGVDPPTIRHSTPVMKRPIEVVFVDIDGKKQWKKRTLDQLRDVVAEVIKSRMPRQQVVAQSSGDTKKTSSSMLEAARKGTASSEEKPSAREQQGAEGMLDSLLLQSSAVDEGFVHLINSAPPSLLPILRLKQFLVLDSGGQPELLEMMPVFLRGASKFVYVLKLHESLDKRATIRYFKDGKLVWEYPAYLTNEGTLRLCVQTMRSLNNKNPDIPPAKMMFLATHRDMVADEQLPGVLDTLHKS
ncbi:hypothetical protein GBAR_LOCUS4771 [Geodia barretti]|uniref:Uncharacterized protein n=1 Tax=Geodia barretti TaxID=519541 RepID=A0AA35R8X5_GEOBA|nr:hypothetical protein GBAR_LOCUS4771 [Geodia barretti]